MIFTQNDLKPTCENCIHHKVCKFINKVTKARQSFDEAFDSEISSVLKISIDCKYHTYDYSYDNYATVPASTYTTNSMYTTNRKQKVIIE